MAALREVKEKQARLARLGNPSLLPYLSLVPDRDVTQLLLQVSQG